jgi:hypothetical protein
VIHYDYHVLEFIHNLKQQQQHFCGGVEHDFMEREECETAFAGIYKSTVKTTNDYDIFVFEMMFMNH